MLGAELGGVKMAAINFEVMLGSLTTTGSLMAFAKLQGMVRGTPMTFKGQNVFNLTLSPDARFVVATVNEPASGAKVSRTLKVSGVATVFEAPLRTDALMRVLRHRRPGKSP